MGSHVRRLPPGIRAPVADPANETLEHFERFCWTLPDPDTSEGRFTLEEWQIPPLEDFFAKAGEDAENSWEARFFQHLWEWPTGLGKSTLFGAIALHHGMYVVKRPRVYVIGGELEHARNTLNAAGAFINESRTRNWSLGFMWEHQEFQSGRIIPLWLRDKDVGIFAKSAGRHKETEGGSSVEGKDPSLIIVEELHRHKDGGTAVSVLISKTIKAGARHQTVKCLIGTTAGTNRDSHLGRLEASVFDEAHGAVVERDRRPGEYYVRAVDPEEETVAHIWAVPETIVPPPLTATTGKAVDAYLDEVLKASPASWITHKGLKRVWKALGRLLRWQFIRQNANQWVTAGLGAIDRGQFGAQRVKGLTIPEGPGVRVVIGLDRGYKWATTAIVPVWKPPGAATVRCAGAVILKAPRDGRPRRTRDVGTILEMMRQRWPDMIVAFDRAQGGGDVAEELEENHGITIVDHGQGVPFELASMKLAEYVENRKIEWDCADKHIDAFLSQILSTVVQWTAGGKKWRGAPPDGETPIDAFDGLAMALNVATSPLPAGKRKIGNAKPSEYRIEEL